VQEDVRRGGLFALSMMNCGEGNRKAYPTFSGFQICNRVHHPLSSVILLILLTSTN
jgi:hypothetical protein